MQEGEDGALLEAFDAALLPVVPLDPSHRSPCVTRWKLLLEDGQRR